MAEQVVSIPDLSRPWPLLPLRSAVLFPNVVVPFDIGRPKTIALAESLAESLSTKAPTYVVASTPSARSPAFSGPCVRTTGTMRW